MMDIHIGKPIPNTQIYILDKYNNILPIGHIGELCIAGDGVGGGYLNRPELTAEKFIDNPFGEGKMYKTGDLAYWREDGNIMFVGRNDFQVKIRGLRIELGEIENAICSTGKILQAAVVVRKDKNGRQFICAFYTERIKIDVTEIKKIILNQLPQYMLPHIFVSLDKMPYTLSGKINYKALPETDLHRQSEIEYVAPQTENEKILISAVESVLNMKGISVYDNFFDIGGDSLKAIELISKLEVKGYSIDIKHIFDTKTMQEMALKLTVSIHMPNDLNLVGDIPATPAQMRIYTAHNIQNGTTAYNIPFIFKTEDLDSNRLQAAFEKLIQRHESLRTQFENKEGIIVQVIKSSVKFVLEKRENNNILEFIRPFDLSKAPLIRAGYYQNMVMIDVHHIISDGSTMAILIDELNELYMERYLNNKPVQYREFALQEKDISKNEKYWLSVYHDELPELEIHTDFPRNQKQTFNGNAIYELIEENIFHKIKEKCKKINITPYVYYMSAFNILLSKFSSNEDIIIGMPISGRSSKFLKTFGMFVNTIPLRNKPIGTKTVKQFVDEVKKNSIAAIANQDYPYGNLIKKLKLDIRGKNSLFDVMFAYQNEKMTDIIFGDKKADILQVPITISKYDLTFNIMPRNHDAVLMVEYCTDLYRENTIKRMINGFKMVLRQMLNENTLIMDICVIDEQEMNKLVHTFNDTYLNYPKDKCIHQLFEEQVIKTPNKTAVVACDRILTYDELNKLSNRIANALIINGIGNGDIVAFALPRKSCLIAVMFGILKSGAAYMPLDLSYPQDRIDYLLHESKARLCITDEMLNELLICQNIMNPNVSIVQEDNFCALHTSGSTGVPKLSLIKHKGVMNLLFYLKNKKLYNKIDVTISVTIVTFDAFIQDTVIPISIGIKSVLASDDAIYNQSKFEKLFENTENACMFCTPTKLKNYIELSDTKGFLHCIRTLFIGGEVFQDELFQLILNNVDNLNCVNGYGPTETTIYSSCSCICTIDL